MPRVSKRPEILVFEAEAKSSLPVAESFHRRGFRVVAASSRRCCASYYSRSVRERIAMPSEVHEPDACLAFLLRLVRRRRFEMIVPLGDIVTGLVSQHRDEFARYSKFVVVPYDTFRLGRDKVETMKAAARCGVPLPNTWYPEERALDQIAREVEYPVLVKPAVANGARGIHYVHDQGELIRTYDEVFRAFGRTFVQELIPHTGMQYKADIILDRDGTLLAGVAYNKIRYYPPAGGSSVLNKSVRYPELLDHAARLARGIGWFGMCDFDFIHDVRDNAPKIMEINPRFPESFRMCAIAGVDFPEILHRMACGEKVRPVLEYKTDRYLRFLAGDALWFLTTRGQRFRTRPSFFNFFDPSTTDNLWSLRDPGPMIGYLLENGLIMLNARERAFRYRLEQARH